MKDGIYLARPLALYLIWCLPLFAAVVFLGMRRRRKLLEGFALAPALNHISPDASAARRWIKAGLLLLTLLALIIALAGPRYGYTWQTLQRSGTSLVVALDCSKSMLAQDVQPDRLQRAKREIQDLLGLLKGERVGLVAFAGTAFLQCPLTLDHEALTLFLSVLGPEYLPVGGTDLAMALRTSLDAFEEKDAGERFILMITDGEATSPAAREEALEVAQEAAAQGVRIYCIGVGSDQGAPVPAGEQGGFAKDAGGAIVHSRLDEGTLRAIAEATGGEYVRSVSGDMDLTRIYNKHIGGGETSETEERIQRFTDRYQWLVGLALALLLAELFIGGRKRSLPGGLFTVVLLLALMAPADVLAASARDLSRQGIAAYNKEEYATAQERFLAAQAEEPESPTAAYNAGAAAYKNEDFQQAFNQFQRVVKDLKPEDDAALTPERPSDELQLLAKALYNQGNAAYRLGRLSEAISLYEQALKLAPDDEEAEKNLEFVRKKLEEQPPQEQNGDGQENPKQDGQDKKDQKDQGKQKQDKDSDSKQDGKKGEQEAQEQNKEEQDGQSRGESEQNATEQEQPDQSAAPEKQEQGPQPENQGNQSPEYESSMDKQSMPEPPEGEQASAGAAEQAEEQPEKELPAAPRSLDDNMLNRLEDKPGRALMPRYEKREVERDW